MTELSQKTPQRSVEVWLLSNQLPAKVLLLRVSPDATRPASWQPITGDVESAENARMAAIREVREETGLELEIKQLELVHPAFDETVDTGKLRKTVFFARVAEQPVQINPEEHRDSRWVDPRLVAATLHWPSNRATWRLAAAAAGVTL